MTALKKLKWPASWEDRDILEHFAGDAGEFEKVVLEDYPMSLEVGSIRF